MYRHKHKSVNVQVFILLYFTAKVLVHPVMNTRFYRVLKKEFSFRDVFKQIEENKDAF